MSKFFVNEDEKRRILNLHECAKKNVKTIEEQIAPLDPMIQQKIDYIKSPIYKQRLVAYGVKDPDSVIQDRVKRLQATTFKTTQNGQALTSDGGMDKPKITLNTTDSRYVKAHEIGHVTGGDDTRYTVNNPHKAKGNQMSPAEAWKFYNRNKNLAKTVPGIKNPQTGKVNPGTTSYRDNVYDYQQIDKSNMSPDPASELYGAKNILDVTKGKIDPHEIGSAENKGDLDAIRQLLHDNKITQNYGDNITPEQWKKALANPKIAREPHVVRMRNNFDDNSICDLNNIIAIRNPYTVDNGTIA